ncbi:MAG TPA: hypothetical protein DIT04_11830, partial [Dysgonomonas sp.]|nr:hypothetical protein [Dysgonomonas sp.]
MRVNNIKTTINKIIVLFAFILLTLNISFNLFRISTERNLYSFDEALTIGRIIKSEQDGLFSAAGFPGVVYNKEEIFSDSIVDNQLSYDSHTARDIVIRHNLENQFRWNLKWDDSKIPIDYYPYTSQSGGSALLYSVVNLILPFDGNITILILRLISGSLLATCLMLFVGWCWRNFGSISAFTVYILLFISPWIVFMGGSLWWSVYTYYIPFLTMLLLLERRHKFPDKINNKILFTGLFIAVFIKHLLFGFEFVTTILLAIYPPVIYYWYIEKRSLSSFFIFSFKAGIVSLLA